MTRQAQRGHAQARENNRAYRLRSVDAAVARCELKRNPFHPFSSFDTATVAGVAFGQTVLAKALAAAGLAFDSSEAHSAAYDAERTAELFCVVCNRFRGLYEAAVYVPGRDGTD